MFTLIVEFLVSRGLAPQTAHRVSIALLIAVALGAAVLVGQCVFRKAVDNQEQQHSQQLQTRNAEAREKAAEQRATDVAASQKLEKDLNNATAQMPDALPTPRRLARACAQLRAQGDDTSRLPQCNGPAPAGKAPAGPG
jgi:predicted negative regulator of RcsB-dependent stress response